MNYTNNTEQIVFLRDADIAKTIDGKTISSQTITSNGIPAFDLFKDTYNELSTYDNNLCIYIKHKIELSANQLCSEISNLSNETIVLSDNICLSINSLSDIVENIISNDLYLLSTGTCVTSAFLSNQIRSLWDDVKGGVNYKGHLTADSTTLYEGKTYTLSGLFASYYDLLDGSNNLTADKSLNNGWLYNFTTTNTDGYVTNDAVPIHFENNDYIIIHNPNASCVNVSDITREMVDIIEAVQTDYVRFGLLNNISNVLSNDYINKIFNLSTSLSTTTKLSVENLQGQLTSNDADIEYLSGQHDWLSTSLSNDINSLSTALSTDIDSLSTTLSTDIDNLSTSLSNTVKRSVEELQGQLTSNDADIEYLSGQHDWLSSSLSLDLSNEISSRIKAVQDLSSSLSGDINSLSDRLSVEISSVSSYTTLSIENLCSEISSNDKNISDISVDLISVSNRYSNTFVGKDKSGYTDHISSDNLIITDIAHPHGQYYMSFESGTIVLKPLK